MGKEGMGAWGEWDGMETQSPMRLQGNMWGVWGMHGIMSAGAQRTPPVAKLRLLGKTGRLAHGAHGMAWENKRVQGE